MSTWGVYGLRGLDAAGRSVDFNSKNAVKWQARWRVDGRLVKRTFEAKGHARGFHDQLTLARIHDWPADGRGRPVDPHKAPLSGIKPSAPARVVSEAGPPSLSFAEYCETTWWPNVSQTMGDRNMTGHRKNMRDAIDLLVYSRGDPRCASSSHAQPGHSLLLDDLVPDDVVRAVIARRSFNDRTKAKNARRLAAALAAGKTDIELEPEQASPATVRAFYITVGMILRSAKNSGHIERDPMLGVEAFAPKPRTQRIAERIVPSIDEVFDLADAIAAIGPREGGRPVGERFRSLVLVAGTLGPRPGELVAHRPDWVRFGDPTTLLFAETEAAVYDTETQLRGNRTRPLKHRAPGETREVPALEEVADALREHFERGYASADRTWTSPRGRHLNWGNIIEPYWRPACRRVFAGTAKNSLVDMTPKMLRKAAITWWADNGIHPFLAGEWAGHSAEVAQRYYAGRASLHFRQEIQRLALGRAALMTDEHRRA